MKVREIVSKIKKKETTCVEVVKYYLEQIEKKNKELNAILEVFDDAIEQAKKIDEKIKSGVSLGKLAGVPILIKDNILYKGKVASCASKFLQNYKAQYNSTVVNKLLSEDAVIIGRANMDEFAMGGSNENSAYGLCKNAHDNSRVAGGSSGGSAVAVASGMVPCALGTDTGGSIRQPSSYNGVVGIKPTYGRVSRYGIIAFASSLDQVGPITQDVEDNALLLSVIAGADSNDETTLQAEADDYSKYCGANTKALKIGLIKQVKDLMGENKKFNLLIDWLEKQGNEIVEVEVPNISLCLPVYYILAPAEATSNLGRFDGVKYSRRAKEAINVDDIYTLSRTQGFGKEVKRRIMLGNFVLSSGYFDAYYNKAKKIQQQIKKEFTNAFKKCDCIIMPTTYGEAFKIGAHTNPVEMYMEDMFTIPANIASLPAISIPYACGENKLPLGVQILADKLDEKDIYSIASYIQKNWEVK